MAELPKPLFPWGQESKENPQPVGTGGISFRVDESLSFVMMPQVVESSLCLNRAKPTLDLTKL